MLTCSKCDNNETSDYPPNFVVYDLRAKEVVQVLCAQCISNCLEAKIPDRLQSQKEMLAERRGYNKGFDEGKKIGYNDGYFSSHIEDDIPF